jgi:hypothetical protein
MVKVSRNAVEIVGPERARFASLVPVGGEHEMIDNQLRAPVEQVGQRQLAPWPVEAVGLVHPLPRQGLPAAREGVTLAGKHLFGDKQLASRVQPFFV